MKTGVVFEVENELSSGMLCRCCFACSRARNSASLFAYFLPRFPCLPSRLLVFYFLLQIIFMLLHDFFNAPLRLSECSSPALEHGTSAKRGGRFCLLSATLVSLITQFLKAAEAAHFTGGRQAGSCRQILRNWWPWYQCRHHAKGGNGSTAPRFAQEAYNCFSKKVKKI